MLNVCLEASPRQIPCICERIWLMKFFFLFLILTCVVQFTLRNAPPWWQGPARSKSLEYVQYVVTLP